MSKPRSRRELTNISVADLQSELGKRRSNLDKLENRYVKLAAELARIVTDIETMGGRVPTVPGLRSGRKRTRNSMTLVDALASALDGKAMSVSDVTDAVQDNGYITTSPSFRTIVNQTLINSGRFKRVRRGIYTLKD